MKPGVRALGVAESFRTTTSVVCGAVTTTTGRVDGIGVTTCSVGGLDATDAILEIWEQAGREDVHYLFVSGVALAWYNLIEFNRLVETVPVPVIAITYEASDGLAGDIRREFSGPAATERLGRYERLPPRERIEIDDRTLFVRTADHSDLDPSAVIRSFVTHGHRPEPVRVARLAARAIDAWRHEEDDF